MPRVRLFCLLLLPQIHLHAAFQHPGGLRGVSCTADVGVHFLTDDSGQRRVRGRDGGVFCDVLQDRAIRVSVGEDRIVPTICFRRIVSGKPFYGVDSQRSDPVVCHLLHRIPIVIYGKQRFHGSV